MTTGYRNEIWHTYLQTQNSSLVLEQWKIDAGILDLYVQTKDMENCKYEKFCFFLLLLLFFWEVKGGWVFLFLCSSPLHPHIPLPPTLYRELQKYTEKHLWSNMT